MKGLLLVLSLVAVSSPALGQSIPLSTESAEARALFERGRLSAFHYRFSYARTQLAAASASDPDFALVYIYRGGSSYDDREARRRYFDRAIELGEHATEAERRMITAFETFLWHGDHAGAVEIFESLAEEYPDEAQALLDDSLARHADDPYTHDFIGRLYLDLARPVDAARVLRRALALDPDFEYARTHLLAAEAALSPD